MSKIRESGFTLIELLVVIAIIALLMGILMPALNRVREQARTITCRSNLNQYGIGMRLYLDDNSYYFPNTSTWMSSKTSSWIRKGETPDGEFWPYVRNLDCHLCPRFNQLAKGTQYGDTQVSYVLNSYIGRGGTIWGNWLGSGVTGVSKETAVYRPSEVITFTEENPWTIDGYSNYPFNDTHFTVGNASRKIDNYATFHNAPGDLNEGGANMVFVDGHVDIRRRTAIDSTDQTAIDRELEEGFRLAWPKEEIPY